MVFINQLFYIYYLFKYSTYLPPLFFLEKRKINQNSLLNFI
jgi:hypothetical protein